ncbi:uncharacterized protein LOC128985806 isoform X2 [Macrosteles quadrilineatus]|nr:uncharacterized protein LOC128985806 isoform X2 [Macrosteles quadrilineatus]
MPFSFKNYNFPSDRSGLFSGTVNSPTIANTGMPQSPQNMFQFGFKNFSDSSSSSSTSPFGSTKPFTFRASRPVFSSPFKKPHFGFGHSIVHPGDGDNSKSRSKVISMNSPVKIPDFEETISESCEGEVKKLLTDLQGLIECPICLESLGTSAKQCENGHGICGTCFNTEKGNKCPTCQCSYLPNKPILLTQILDRLPKLCSFADKGCDVMLFDKKAEHETFCKFRPTMCKFESCQWKGTVDAVIDHVRRCEKSTTNTLCQMHLPNVKHTMISKFDKTQNASVYSAIIYQNQLFWNYFHRDGCSKMVSYKFHHVASSKPKQKYYLIISFMKGEIEFKTCVEATLETSIHSQDIERNQVCLFLSDEYLERFCDSEGEGYVYTQQIITEEMSINKAVVC